MEGDVDDEMSKVSNLLVISEILFVWLLVSIPIPFEGLIAEGAIVCFDGLVASCK